MEKKIPNRSVRMFYSGIIIVIFRRERKRKR